MDEIMFGIRKNVPVNQISHVTFLNFKYKCKIKKKIIPCQEPNTLMCIYVLNSGMRGKN